MIADLEDVMFLFLFFVGCDKENRVAAGEVIRTPYGYDCIKTYSGDGFSSITCWESKDSSPKNRTKKRE